MDRRSVLIAGLAGGALPLAARAQQEYPNKPIRMIVPYVAGGGIDNFARPFAQKLAEQMGQPILVDNPGGASGLIGASAVAKSAPDGYTLLCHAQTLYLSPQVTKSPPIDPVKEFTPIVRIVVTPVVVVVHESLPAKNMKELLELARATPGGLDFVTAGPGSQQQLTGEIIAAHNRVKFTHVAYKGGNQALTDLVGGQVKVGILVLSTVLPFVHSGKLRVIGAIESHRSSSFPDIPTLAENGLPGFSMPDTFIALYGPAGLSPAIARRLHAEARKAVESPEVRAALKTIGYEPALTASPEDFQAVTAKTYAMFKQMLSETNMKLE